MFDDGFCYRRGGSRVTLPLFAAVNRTVFYHIVFNKMAFVRLNHSPVQAKSGYKCWGNHSVQSFARKILDVRIRFLPLCFTRYFHGSQQSWPFPRGQARCWGRVWQALSPLLSNASRFRNGAVRVAVENRDGIGRACDLIGVDEFVAILVEEFEETVWFGWTVEGGGTLALWPDGRLAEFAILKLTGGTGQVCDPVAEVGVVDSSYWISSNRSNLMPAGCWRMRPRLSVDGLGMRHSISHAELFVRHLMKSCADSGVGFWKLSI